METKNIHGAGVLAGAYKGNGIDRTLLIHAVSDVPVSAGRLKREYGEAFCKRSIDLVDSVVWQAADAVTCPVCLSVLERLKR